MIDRDFSKEFEFKTSRSGGPGGQNVNKVSSKVELRFQVQNSELLTDEEKIRVQEKLANYITNEGYLQVICQTERRQLSNKEIAVQKFYDLLRKAFTKQKVRKATKPSKAAHQERLTGKKKLSDKKSNRGKVNPGDF